MTFTIGDIKPMTATLGDITIYYSGEKRKLTLDESKFTYVTNYICHFYHKMMFGYKPPKTGRICIHIHKNYIFTGPAYFGSICSITNNIDEDKYLTLEAV